MKLTSLNEDEYRILQMVVREFYVALPESLKTYSVFTTHLLSKALQHYRIKTRVIPCRLWCSTSKPKKEFVGGLFNFDDAEKWNGHVICLAGDWLVDTAIYHLNPTFGYQVPKIIAKRIVFPEPQIYTRHKLNKKTEFVWYRLPPAIPAIPLVGYDDLVVRYLPTLLAHLDNLLSGRAKAIDFVSVNKAQPVDDSDEQATDAANAAESNGVADNDQTEDAEGLNIDSVERYSTEMQQSSDYDEVSANA